MMVKNHALKNTARARKAETGETLPEAMRNSVTEPSTKKTGLPVIHLGSNVQLDLNKSPNLTIIGGPGTGKTKLLQQVINQLEAYDVRISSFTANPEERFESTKLNPFSIGGDDGHQAKIAVIMESLANRARKFVAGEGSSLDKPMILIVDPITELSDEAMIYLQMIYKWGRGVGIHVFATALEEGAVPSVIRSNSSTVRTHHDGLAVLDNNSFFKVGELGRSEASGFVKVGDKAQWDLDKGHLMILGRPGIGKTELAKQIALEALTTGKSVTVMASRANEVSWRESYGEVIPIHSEMSPDVIDKVTAHNWGKDSNQSILIVDGGGLRVQNRRASDYTLAEKVKEAAFLNALRSNNFRIVFIDTEESELGYFFGNTVLLADMLPKDEQAMQGVQLHQIIGAAPLNNGYEHENFYRAGVGSGLLVAPRHSVYERFEF